MASLAKRFNEVVSAWPQITTRPHQFAAREFNYGKAEVGHLHLGGALDIPFPRAVRDVLLEEHLAEEHRWVPDSGWITFHIRDEKDLDHGLWLMRLSYLRYALKTADDPNAFLQSEIERLKLDGMLAALLAKFVPVAAH